MAADSISMLSLLPSGVKENLSSYVHPRPTFKLTTVTPYSSKFIVQFSDKYELVCYVNTKHVDVLAANVIRIGDMDIATSDYNPDFTRYNSVRHVLYVEKEDFNVLLEVIKIFKTTQN
jgi:hypothetical protein